MGYDRSDRYRPGGFYRISDRDGSRRRASDTRKEWTGAIVGKDEFEDRHPQDFVRGKKDNQSVPDARPEAIDHFVGPLKTETAEASIAGDNSIVVADATRFRPGDDIAFYLANGDRVRMTILSIIGNEFFFDGNLKWNVDVGSAVTNFTAIAPGYEG